MTNWLPDWLHGLSLPLALLLLAPQAEAYPNVTIKSCWDGDSCRTSTGEKIRLACIDTPELTGLQS